jgi:hypothetical protein
MSTACKQQIECAKLTAPMPVDCKGLLHLKGQCHEIFCFWFFYESVSPQPQSVPLGPFRIFFKKSLRYWQLKGPNGILRGLGETDSWKNQKQKISLHCPFNCNGKIQ